MRIGLFYKSLDGAGGYPADFRKLASTIEDRGHEVIRYSGSEDSGINATLKALRGNHDSLDVLHIVGLYLPINFLIASAARSGRIPYVCSLLGQHAPALLGSHRTLRKRLLFHEYDHRVVKRAAAVHYFSSWERQLQRDLNNCAFEAAMGVPPPGFREPIREPKEGFVFFGRNDVYQKGLDLLLEAFAEVLPVLGEEWGHLTIAGRHHGNSERTLNSSIERFGLQDRVELKGPSEDESPIGQARVLVYPSRYDGPPRPPRAALSLGIPVVVTTSTNLGDGVAAYNAGWVAQPTVESLGEALTSVATSDNAELDRKSRNTSALAARWSWAKVASDYVVGYEAALLQ